MIESTTKQEKKTYRHKKDVADEIQSIKTHSTCLTEFSLKLKNEGQTLNIVERKKKQYQMKLSLY